jgi:hypothetical protein
MNLPFFPTFFRKMDIFQQLKEYESQNDEKHLWKGEKCVLIWAASEHHQHLGSAIEINHVKDALDYCVSRKIISAKERDELKGSSRHILESLPVYEFGELQVDSEVKNPRVKINRNGILAGRILRETKSLRNTHSYDFWIVLWWAVLLAAAVILVSQTCSAIRDLV